MNPKIGSPEAMRLEPPIDPPEDEETEHQQITRRAMERTREDAAFGEYE